MRFELELMVKYSLLPLPYLPELPLMLPIGVIRVMVVFPQRLLNESSSLLIAEADEYTV